MSLRTTQDNHSGPSSRLTGTTQYGRSPYKGASVQSACPVRQSGQEQTKGKVSRVKQKRLKLKGATKPLSKPCLCCGRVTVLSSTGMCWLCNDDRAEAAAINRLLDEAVEGDQ